MDTATALRGAGYRLVNGRWVKPWAYTILMFDEATRDWHQCFVSGTGEARVYTTMQWDGSDLSVWLADRERYTARQDLRGCIPPHFSKQLMTWD